MSVKNDIIIIGGGIIGCSIAYFLARKGYKATILERGQPGEEASWAAAGMLAAQSEEAHNVQYKFADLCFTSREMYPQFITELESETGMKVDFRCTGSLFVAKDFQEASALTGLFKRQKEHGKPVEEVEPAELQKLEPAIKGKVETSLFLPEDCHVDNRKLMKVLVAALHKLGVEIQTRTEVIGLDIRGNRVQGVKTLKGTISCGLVVLAAGSWSGLIDTGNKISLPVRPIRGQIVCLEMHPQPLHHLIHSTGCYLVPWPDGRILVGSTLENVGFNKDVTAHGVHQLLHAALEIVPGLAEARLTQVWAGLRPDTRDNLPILGKTPVEGLIVATGHFRNGILLAPITAKLITELITKNETSYSLEPFSLQRFNQEASD